jgi:hypothetical protein
MAAIVPCTLLAATFATTASAEVFRVQASVGGVQAQDRSFASVEDAVDVLSNEGLEQVLPTYSGTETVAVNLDFRGVPMLANYLTAGSSALTFSIPSLNINETFIGTDRDDSQDMLVDYLKENKTGLLDRLGRELVKKSPVDPLAGNPNSLMSNIVEQNFMSGVGGFATSMRTPDECSTGGDTENLFGFGLSMGRYKVGGEETSSISLPLSYIIRSDANPRRQFTISLPLSYSTVGDSKGYGLGLNLAYRLPVTKQWALTPAVGAGASGSIDLGSVGAVRSVSLASAYVIPFGQNDLSIGNMVGQYKSLKVSVGDFTYDPKVTNVAYRNGLTFSQKVDLLGAGRRIEYSLADTRFTGTELFIDNTQEVSIVLASSGSSINGNNFWRFGGKYLYSDKIKSYMFTVGSWF